VYLWLPEAQISGNRLLCIRIMYIWKCTYMHVYTHTHIYIYTYYLIKFFFTGSKTPPLPRFGYQNGPVLCKSVYPFADLIEHLGLFERVADNTPPPPSPILRLLSTLAVYIALNNQPTITLLNL